MDDAKIQEIADGIKKQLNELGCVVVPVEPTDAMVQAAIGTGMPIGPFEARQVYDAMLGAIQPDKLDLNG